MKSMGFFFVVVAGVALLVAGDILTTKTVRDRTYPDGITLSAFIEAVRSKADGMGSQSNTTPERAASDGTNPPAHFAPWAKRTWIASEALGKVSFAGAFVIGGQDKEWQDVPDEGYAFSFDGTKFTTGGMRARPIWEDRFKFHSIPVPQRSGVIGETCVSLPEGSRARSADVFLQSSVVCRIASTLPEGREILIGTVIPAAGELPLASGKSLCLGEIEEWRKLEMFKGLEFAACLMVDAVPTVEQHTIREWSDVIVVGMEYRRRPHVLIGEFRNL